jgi:hypothetical protein
MQGLSMGEISYQGALSYARERLQMRSLSGPKNPDGPADPIMVHPDVRRMLLTQKAFVEGQRALIYWLAQQVDLTQFGSDIQKTEATQLLELLTPIAKAFCTETSQEVTYLGVQVYGGHGYISDNGMERIARDNRISTVYEGTTGIQSLDLIGRKVLGSGGAVLNNFTKIIHKYCKANEDNAALAEFIAPLAALNKEWGEVTMAVGEKAMANADEVGAASVDYLMYSGYITFAYLWAQMAEVAQQKLDAGSNDPLYSSKLKTARFYFQRLLPRTASHKAAMLAGADSLMDMSEAEFIC